MVSWCLTHLGEVIRLTELSEHMAGAQGSGLGSLSVSSGLSRFPFFPSSRSRLVGDPRRHGRAGWLAILGDRGGVEMCPFHCPFPLHSFLSRYPEMASLPSPDVSHLMPGLQRAVRGSTGFSTNLTCPTTLDPDCVICSFCCCDKHHN